MHMQHMRIDIIMVVVKPVIVSGSFLLILWPL